MSGPPTDASPRFVAVLDIGKTNAKVVLHDITVGEDVISRSLPNVPRQDGPYPHADTEQLFDFILGSLAEIVREARIDAISITSHGACGALIQHDRLALPILDYEHDGPAETAEAYDRIRPPFAETFSPRLPNGLNLGAQIYWQQQRFHREFEHATALLTYPQYWAWRLSGVMASEATSLGCHTDLWAPFASEFSTMVAAQKWRHLFPPLRRAFDALGPVEPNLARQVGIASPTPVHCGIHDSNASLLPHLLDATPPFSVVSTGTWVICFAVGGSPHRLDFTRDTLVNVDAFRQPVPSARFMGGREFAILGEQISLQGKIDKERLASVLRRQVMILPSVVSGSGPYPDSQVRWLNDAGSMPADREIAVSLYLACMTATCLDLIGAAGPVIIEGPFSTNALYCEALAALRRSTVQLCAGTTGASGGAALLASSLPLRAETRRRAAHPHALDIDHLALQSYFELWSNNAAAPSISPIQIATKSPSAIG